MLIGWTLVLQCIVDRSTSKPIPTLSIIVRMACKLLPCHFVSIIVHEMLKICHRKNLQDQTTTKTTALYMVVKEKYHEHTKAHLCNSQFGPRHRKADHIIAILLELDIVRSRGPQAMGKLSCDCGILAKRGGGRGKNYFIFAFFSEPIFA